MGQVTPSPTGADKNAIIGYFLQGKGVDHIVFLMDYKFGVDAINAVLREAIFAYRDHIDELIRKRELMASPAPPPPARRFHLWRGANYYRSASDYCSSFFTLDRAKSAAGRPQRNMVDWAYIMEAQANGLLRKVVQCDYPDFDAGVWNWEEART